MSAEDGEHTAFTVASPWGEVLREPVHFFSEGSRIAADVFWPPGAANDPAPLSAVVLAAGFGGQRRMHTSMVGQCLAAAGHAAMVFDYRGFGDSEGEKWRLMPHEQVEDLLNAVTFVRTLDHVDPDRVGLYGTSMGGGYVIIAAARDPRIRSVVSAVGVTDGRRWLRSLRRNWEWIEFTKRIERDRVHRVLHGTSEVVAPEEIMVRDPESLQNVERLNAEYPGRAYTLTLRHAEALMHFSPQAVAAQIGPRPVLVVAIRDDAMMANDEAIGLYEELHEPKGLHPLTGAILRRLVGN